MKIHAQLPPDREAEGTLVVVDDAGLHLAGPFRCRGEADNSGAKAHGNVQEDPRRAFGDHPYGTSIVGEVLAGPAPAKSYGPFFLRLRPVSGEALEARNAGRVGIGIHGGDLAADGSLRVTFGCLRTDNDTVETLAKYVTAEKAGGRDVFYDCAPSVP